MRSTLKITLWVQLFGGKFIKQGNYFEFLGDFGKSCVKKRLAVSLITIATYLFWYFIMANLPRVVLKKRKKGRRNFLSLLSIKL